MKLEKILLVLAVIFALSRILVLDADPFPFKQMHDIVDEGYWAHESRSMVLFGEWMPDDFIQTLAAAPLYALLSSVAFRAFGVSLYSTRLVCAVAGILSILLLYLIVRRSGERLAAIAAFLLAVNNAFFVYNRISHLESLVIFFLLLSFFFLSARGRRANFYSFLAGICFVLAGLSKITAIYFVPAMLLYLIASYLREDITLRGILAFLAGSLLVAIPVLAFFYIPLLPVFLPVLKSLSAGYPSAWLRIVNLWVEWYFAMPSVFLLLVLALLFLGKRRILLSFADIRRNLQLFNGVELIAFSWFFGYMVGLLFSDLSNRRFTILIIPLVLFASMLLQEDRKLGALGLWMKARERKLEDGRAVRSSLPETLLVFLLSFCIFSLIHRIVALAEFVGQVNLPNGIVFLTEVFLTSLLGAMLLIAMKDYTTYLRRLVWATYTVFCGGAVIYTLLFSSFFARDASRRMSEICDRGEWIIGYAAHELSLENELRPLLWMPRSEGGEHLDEDAIERYRPRYYLRLVNWEGREVFSEDFPWPSPEDIGEPLVYLDTVELWPILGRPRVVLDLYEIDYGGGQDELL